MFRKNQRLSPSGFCKMFECLIPLALLSFSFAVVFPIIAQIRKHHAVVSAQHLMLYIPLTWAIIAFYCIAYSKFPAGSRRKTILEYLGYLIAVYICITLALFVLVALQLLLWRMHHQL
jgi:hypothetical protein